MLKIKEVREKKSFSQEDLVRKTGIPKRSYVNYENGKTDIPFSKLQNIANALEVRIQDLISEEGSILKDYPREDPQQVSESGGAYSNLLQEVHADLKKDLHEMAAGMEKNFSVVSDGIFEGLKGQQKLLRFIEGLDSGKIARASEGLEEFLKTRK